MWKKVFFVVLFASMTMAGCAKAPKENLKNNTSVKKVAVVSLTVSDWGGRVEGGSVGGQSVGSLMQNATKRMIVSTESELAKHWQIRKVDTFISEAKYRKAAEDIQVSTYSPVIKGKEMPLFGAGFKRGDITPEKAKALCAALDVDAVVLVFSEWSSKTGGVVPLTKALSKNVVSFWDSKGEKIYFRRIDALGTRTLGAIGIKAVNEETIEQWVEAYENSLQKMFAFF